MRTMFVRLERHGGVLFDEFGDAQDGGSPVVGSLEEGSSPIHQLAVQRWALESLNEKLHECHLRIRPPISGLEEHSCTLYVENRG
jgi:hypothetical protein